MEYPPVWMELKAGCVHLSGMEGNTVTPLWQVTTRS